MQVSFIRVVICCRCYHLEFVHCANVVGEGGCYHYDCASKFDYLFVATFVPVKKSAGGVRAMPVMAVVGPFAVRRGQLHL